MEAQFRTRDGKLFIKFEAANMKELFEALARNQEVFDADTTCGCCGKSNLRFVCRESSKGNQKFKFYELACGDCHARLQFGQKTDMVSLFPKRTDGDGNYLPNRGWAKWQAKEDQ